MINSINKGENYYSTSEGLLELREEIAKKENAKGLAITADDVLITNGVSEGLDMVISSIVEEGDEVLLPGPYYPPYASYVRLHGGLPVEFSVDLNNSTPDFDDIKSSSEFLTWLEQQPKSISEGITKNNTDPIWASRTVDLYKVDTGIDGKRKSTKSKDAARTVTKATSRDVNVGQNDRTWKISEIQKLKPWEFEKYESEIDQAMKSGRVINE